MSVFEGFQYKGKHYLAYLQSRTKDDEFLMRENIVKPLFQALDYDQQKDFSPEEVVESGRIDTTIWNSNSHPVIVIETQSSLLRDLKEHRNRLITYAEEVGAHLAVLTDGVRFEVWECPGRGKTRYQRTVLNFQEIYQTFLRSGIDGLSERDWDNLLKLKYLSKERQFINEEELYEEPELDVSQATIFSQLLGDLQEAMQLVKTDILTQFDSRQEELKGYESLVIQAKTRKVYPSEFRKYEDARKLAKCFEDWQKVSPNGNAKNIELFCTETMYIFFNRLLLIRICEDKGIVARQISNGGIKKWLDFKGFFEFKKANYADLLRSAYDTMNKVYPHLFHKDVFDWYIPESEIILQVLFRFNHYNFVNVDRDVLGKLYEKYLDKEERKRLGEFYTPEEVIDYILKAVGYTPEHEVEGKKLLDPACGSGGFLVRAVKTLVERYQKRGVPAETILDKVQESIYGFDINPFAAHLAEMNVLFQVIDLINEAKITNPDFHMEKFNIFVTNSLRIPKTREDEGRLFKLGEELSEYLEEAEIVKDIKLKQGKFKDGFDFVVGNPPYVRVDKIPPHLRQMYKSMYDWLLVKKWDLYIAFVYRGIDWLKAGGKFGYIVSNKFFLLEHGLPLRKHILQNHTVKQIIDLSSIDVFAESLPAPAIVIIEQQKCPTDSKILVDVKMNREIPDSVMEQSANLNPLEKMEFVLRYLLESVRPYEIKQKRFLEDYEFLWTVSMPDSVEPLVRKIESGCKGLGEICKGAIREGDTSRNEEKTVISSRNYEVLPTSERTMYKKVIRGGNIKRFKTTWDGDWIKCLQKRPALPRLLVKDIAKRLEVTYDEGEYRCLRTIYCAYLTDQGLDAKFVLGILNSQLLCFYYLTHFLTSQISSREGNFRFRTQFLKQLPIKILHALEEKELGREIVELVDQMLEINKKLPKLEKLSSNLPEFLEKHKISTKDLADCPAATLVLAKDVMGKPKIKREGKSVYLDRKSYIKCANAKLAQYLELYLDSISGQLRGKTATELHKLIQVPTQVEETLDKHKFLLSEIEQLKTIRDQTDHTIEQKVYKLYGLTKKEIEIIERKS